MTQKQILAVLQCSMMQNVNKREGSVTFCYTKLIKFYLVKKLDWLEDFLQEVSVNFFFQVSYLLIINRNLLVSFFARESSLL